MKFYILFLALTLATFTSEKETILKDYYEGLNTAEKTNQPILLFFTGLTCKNNEILTELLQNDNETLKNLQEKHVIVTLFVDDQTKLKRHKIVNLKGKEITLRTKGDEWVFIEQSKFNENIQPLMVLIDKSGKMIKEPFKGVITKENLTNYIKE